MTGPKMRLPNRAKGRVEINIDGHYASKVYTGGSYISGEALIEPFEDVELPLVQISLTGTARTVVDALLAPKVTSHFFLKMDAPADQYKHLKANEAVTIPFHFIVPHDIPVPETTINRPSETMKSYQARLPPTMGAGWEKNDLGPHSCQVEYEIKATVSREIGPIETVFSGARSINILPSYPEEPPFAIDEQDVAYTLRKTKALRGRLFAKRGDVTVSTSEPDTLKVDSHGNILPFQDHSLLVDISYEPLNAKKFIEYQPLEIDVVSAKIESQTWYTSTTMTKLPNMGNVWDPMATQQRMCYVTSIPATIQDVEQTGFLGMKSETDDRSVFDAHLRVPISIPATHDHVVLPTFYSKIVARTYSLKLTLNVGGVGGAPFKLITPLQVVVEPSMDKPVAFLDDDELPGFHSIVQARQEIV